MSWIKEIRHDISTIQSTPHELKKFGLTIGGLLLLMCVVAFWKGWWNTSAISLITSFSAFLIIAGMFFSQFLRFIHRWWMSFAIIVGSVVARIILFIVFFSIVTVISFAGKIFGKKFYFEYKDPHQTSYWIKRDQQKSINYERMS